MTFEQHIINEVSRAEPEVKAYFFNGTLFYKSTESQSRRIFSTLMRLQAGRVAIHMVDQEILSYPDTHGKITLELQLISRSIGLIANTK